MGDGRGLGSAFIKEVCFQFAPETTETSLSGCPKEATATNLEHQKQNCEQCFSYLYTEYKHCGKLRVF